MFFSIIVPVYNAGKYLKECLDSIMAQTFSDYEMILIDDGSTDGSADICDSYTTFWGVKIIHQQNCGVAKTRQVGIDLAQGEYILFIDADDWVDINHLEVRYRKLQESHPEVLWSAFMRHGIQTEQSEYEPNTFLFTSISETLKAKFQSQIFTGLFDKTYNRAFLKSHQISFEKYNYNEDRFFNTQVLFYARHIEYDNNATYHYRYNPSSMLREHTKVKMKNFCFDSLMNITVENSMFHFSDNQELQPYFYNRVNELKRVAVRELYREPSFLETLLELFPESSSYIKIKSLKDFGFYMACKYRCYLFYSFRNAIVICSH